MMRIPFDGQKMVRYPGTIHLCWISLALPLFFALCSAPVFAAEKTSKAKSDPKALIGKEVTGGRYPDGWRFGKWARHEKDRSYTLLIKGKTSALVVEKKEIAKNPDVSKIIAAVLLKGRPKKGIWHELSSECKVSDGRLDTVIGGENKILLAEVVYQKCARYSNNILSAWVLDLRSSTITPYPAQGLRCGNTYLDSGEFTECKFIPKEQ